MSADPRCAVRWRNLLRAPGAFQIGRVFPTAQAALEQLPRNPRIGLVLVDTLPGSTAIQFVQQLHLLLPKVPILVLANKPRLSVVLGTLAAGGVGFLRKDCPRSKLPGYLHEATRGGFVLSSRAQRHLLELIQEASGLRKREAQIIKLLLTGSLEKEIPDELGLRYSTVHTHLARLFYRHQVHSWRELIHQILSHMQQHERQPFISSQEPSEGQ